MPPFDVVIVGAGCAGSALATFLARAGLRVCLLDRARFPRETPSTHVIQPHGVGILDRLGVLDAVLAAGAVPLRRLTMVTEDVRIDATLDATTFPAPGLCVRRRTLDALLVDAAAAAGADLRTGCRATNLLRDASGRVTGVQTPSGPVTARLTVGADGRHSTVAAGVGASEYLVTPPGRIPLWGYFSGVSDREGRLRIGRLGDSAFLAGPTDGGLHMAAIAVDRAAAAPLHADRSRYFAETLTHWPELHDLLAGARREGPLRVLTDWHGYFRDSAGPGWALVGDAGHFKDFAAAQGISDALRQARRFADGVLGADSPVALDAAVRRWWRWRDRDAHAMYWLAADMGRAGATTPLLTNVMRQIAADPAATARLLRVLDHELPPSTLFTPRLLARAATRTFADHPRNAGRTVADITRSVRAEVVRARNRRTPRRLQ